jgi:toxin ParE1/3/4
MNRICRFTIPASRNIESIMENVLSFPLDDYLIFYIPIAAGIQVLRVVSGYRDLENLFCDGLQ